MAKKKGICRNIDGGCSLAEGKVVQEAESTSFVCEECGSELYEVKGASKVTTKSHGPNWGLVALIAAAVIALGVAAFFLLRNKGPKTIPVESVTLDKAEVTFQDSEPFTLSVTIMPEDATDKTVVWSVSDERIVRSNGDGTFQCMNEGEAIVTATAGEASATCTVTVTPLSMYSPVESLTLDKKNLSLKVGATAELLAAVAPVDAEDMSVIWTSSDETVVTVEEGKVKAIKEGKVTVTAVSVSNPEVKDDCEVTVTQTPTGYSLGWGTYTGPMQGGKPHGLGGEVKVTKAYSLDLKKGSGDVRSLNKGDKIVDCKFKDGKLVSGFIHYADGRQERINIGT
jgi:hypothetical protein